MSDPITPQEMDDLWEVMRPYCEAKGIGREAFEIGTRIIEAVKTPEDAKILAEFLRGQGGSRG